MAKDNPNQWEARKAMERVHKLRGGMAVIRVGAPTTLGMGYLKDKADDAVHATQAALEEGIVEGGGMCLWRIAQNMRPQTIGERIMEKALQAPMRKILSNAGVDYTEIVPTLYADPTLGYDTKQGTYVNLIEEGIVDPAKVERCAVTNAIANAAKFLTAHVAIVDHVETK
jgi:chaperonin GroEL